MRHAETCSFRAPIQERSSAGISCDGSHVDAFKNNDADSRGMAWSCVKGLLTYYYFILITALFSRS